MNGSAFHSAKWGTDICPLPLSTIADKHKEVVRLIKMGKYGGYDAVKELAGTRTANRLNQKHYVCGCALPALSHAASSSKRSIGDLHEYDDNIDVTTDDDDDALSRNVKRRK